MLHHTADGEVVKVLDFGIAKLLGDDLRSAAPVVTGRNELIGTAEAFTTFVAPAPTATSLSATFC